MSQTKNDKAWEILFERHNILANIKKYGLFEIQAKDIKKVREPRLMAKFDHSSQLPRLFKENGLSILPISRSSYVIGEFQVYAKVCYDQKLKPIRVEFPNNITTIDPTNLYSESSALHCAYIAGMIDHMLGEKAVQTLSGRMSSKQFEFLIQSKRGDEHRITIKNAQLEIDGGYESNSHILLVEAKNETVDDFLIRQLYYPYRLWKERTHKKVHPVFFTYSNDRFSFFIYEFTDPNQYNSLTLVKQQDFIIADKKITLDNLADVFHSVIPVREPAIPFPQADSFTRVVDLLGLLMNNEMNKEDITRNYDFDVRQTSYYTSAGMYLDLIEKGKDESGQVVFRLTKHGREIMKLPTAEKFLKLTECILAHEPFRRVFSYYMEHRNMPDKSQVVAIMKNCNLYNVNSESTYFRRASTIIGWIHWIIKLIEIYD